MVPDEKRCSRHKIQPELEFQIILCQLYEFFFFFLQLKKKVLSSSRGQRRLTRCDQARTAEEGQGGCRPERDYVYMNDTAFCQNEFFFTLFLISRLLGGGGRGFVQTLFLRNANSVNQCKRRNWYNLPSKDQNINNHEAHTYKKNIKLLHSQRHR